ncbi:reverse transcriptase [Tanacetum coccineum]|uniref:Reverse transcriptase n=1 Tax=Tanacetum coccineum TaxID=301880 RepID=A0ABQ4YFJ1_9ASTR
MVSTRNNSITPVPIMESMQESIDELKSAVLEIKEGMKTFLVGHKKLSDEVEKLKNGEGTSHNGQDSTNRPNNSLHHSGGGAGNTYNKGNHSYGRLAKIEFPKFSGDDVKGWIYRCNQFFRIDGIEEKDKIQLASMHVYDKALIWHQQFCKRFGENYPWEVYAKEAIRRFDSVFDDPLMELKNLKQDGSVKDYHEKFESLLNRMELNEKHAISLFLGGLKLEISSHIRMFTLDTLTDVYYLAKMQEQTIVAMKSRYGHVLPTPKPVSNVYNKPMTSYPRTSGSNAVVPNTSSRNDTVPFRKRLTQKELEEKRANHMCFYCDEKYFPGHKCSGQLHSLEVVIEGAEDAGEEIFEECTNELLTQDSPIGFVQDVNPQISIHALSGVTSYRTLRIRGYVGKQVGLPFVTDMMVIALGGCEMVLGVQWLATLGDIKFNFQKLTMEFDYGKSKVLLRGTPQTSVQWMQGKGSKNKSWCQKHVSIL